MAAMSLPLSTCVLFGRNKSHFRSFRFSRASASLEIGLQRATSATIASMPASFEERRGRIAELFHKNGHSVSAYDTAWVAMVPSPTSLKEQPCFPNCLNWLLENQCQDGSWARPHHHHLLKKDVLSSTLAVILALKKWGVGEEQINKGLQFIELNFALAADECQITPMGFHIVFPAMLDYARGFNLNLHLEPTTLNYLMHKRDLELKRCSQNCSTEREAYWAYIAEGMGKLQDWESVMKYQRGNGSLFNCPSTTAAAFIALRNSDCLNYLNSALKFFGNAVPAVYPLDIYSQLCTVENLEKLGISRYFSTEIQCVLDETYRCWIQGNEEIFMDASTCALAFRILRMNGYIVNSDPVTKILQECISSSFRGNMRDINITLELYRASEFILYPDERGLEEQNLRLKLLLEQELSIGFTRSCQLGRNINAKVKQALECPFYANLDRSAVRKNIEHYSCDGTKVLKTSYCSPNFGNTDFLFLSIEDFNQCQVIHREELRELERWVIENKLDKLKFARSKSAYCYFSAAATFFAPELSDARMAWAKNGVLTTVVDDFFDVGGSLEELSNLIQWDVDVSTECSSLNVQIIFSALRHTICGIGDKGFKLQGRSITNHIIGIWLDLLNSMMKETEWARDEFVPTMEEYMNNAYVSFALGPIVLPTLYLMGSKLSEEMVNHSEYHNLFKLMSTCGRLLNDIHGYERELKDGKLNALSLYMINNGGEVTKEAAISEMKRWVETQRRELLRLVLGSNTSVLPKSCKELFWHMCSVVHLFYSKDDGFTSQDLIQVVNAVVHEPIVLEGF